MWRGFLGMAMKDKRITVWHISLFGALVYCWEKGDCRNPVSITRRELMQLSHIYSTTTYHKYLLELVAFGFIQYLPSYNPFLGSLVYFNETKVIDLKLLKIG